MVKVKGYRINMPRKPIFTTCNCEWGHMNCKCGGGKSMEYRKCSKCNQHNNNVVDDVCFECREFEYQLNLGE